MRSQKSGWERLPRTSARVQRARGSLRIPRQIRQDVARLRLPKVAGSLISRGEVELRSMSRLKLLSVISRTPSVPAQRRRNLALLVDALDADGIPYFIVPGFSARRYRVGVLDRHRMRVCQALARTHGTSPVYVARMSGSGAEVREATLAGELTPDSLGGPADQLAGSADADAFVTGLEAADDGASPDAAEQDLLEDAPMWPWWRVFEPVQTPDGTFSIGAPYGADLEFWTEQPNGEWVAPRRNQVTPTLPAESRVEAPLVVGGRSYRTFQPFTVPTVDTITFPIDVVYTWVDGSDPKWRADKRAALAAIDPAAMSRLADDEARFVSRDELRYSLRSIEQYAEWVRHVWIVTASGQVPEWLDTSCDRVTVVHHPEIWHPDGLLPTFNSQAIGANLHRIPGLAEHYVYFNDDVFLGRTTTPDTFFHPNGLSKFYYSRSQLGLGDPDPAERAPVSAGRVNRALIEEKFGRTVTQRFFHTPQALRRSVLEEMEQLWPEQFRETSRSTFRRVGDITASSSLHHYYAYCTGRATRAQISYGYVALDRPDLDDHLTRLLKRRNRDTFCLNDLYLGPDPDRVDRLLAGFLDAYFPAPSEFEKR